MTVILEEDSRQGEYTDIRDGLLMREAKRFCSTLKIPWPAVIAKLDTFVHDPNNSVN
jgi:hypothetical protein